MNYEALHDLAASVYPLSFFLIPLLGLADPQSLTPHYNSAFAILAPNLWCASYLLRLWVFWAIKKYMKPTMFVFVFFFCFVFWISSLLLFCVSVNVWFVIDTKQISFLEAHLLQMRHNSLSSPDSFLQIIPRQTTSVHPYSFRQPHHLSSPFTQTCVHDIPVTVKRLKCLCQQLLVSPPAVIHPYQRTAGYSACRSPPQPTVQPPQPS